MNYRCSIRVRDPRRKHNEPYETWENVVAEASHPQIAAETAKERVRKARPNCLVTCHNIEQMPADEVPVVEKRGPGRPKKVA